MFNVPMTKSRLCREKTKVPFWTNEQSADMLGELVDLFTPQGGTVCDRYGGTLTTAIACIRTGRKCYTTEKNKECFEAAIIRLGKFQPTYIPTDNIHIERESQHDVDDKEDEGLVNDSKEAADVLLNALRVGGFWSVATISAFQLTPTLPQGGDLI